MKKVVVVYTVPDEADDADIAHGVFMEGQLAPLGYELNILYFTTSTTDT